MKKKIIFVVLDGVAEPKGHSALKKSKKYYLDSIASHSECGLWTGPKAKNFNPKSMSSIGTLEILGYSAEDEPGRGYLEALGIDIKPKKNQIFLRANFATIHNNKIQDRRAGRDTKGLDTLVKKLNSKIKKIKDIKVKLYRSVGHRGVLVLEGKGLSKNISDNDTDQYTPAMIEPKESKTAQVLNEYIEKSHFILEKDDVNKKRKKPANFILIRSAGSMKKIEQFKKRFNLSACSISSVGIIKGISKYLGIDIFFYENQDLEKSLKEKTNMAMEALKKYDFVILHINGTDTYSHQKDFKGKIKFIEKIDKEIFSKLMELKNIFIAVIGDHETSSVTGEHKFGPVPFLLYCPYSETDRKINFNEECKDFITDSPMRKIMSELVSCT